MKKTYEQPTLKPLGSVRELTLGGQDGQHLDQAFPAQTNRGDLTFS